MNITADIELKDGQLDRLGKTTPFRSISATFTYSNGKEREYSRIKTGVDVIAIEQALDYVVQLEKADQDGPHDLTLNITGTTVTAADQTRINDRFTTTAEINSVTFA
ncbi:hypothetical protein [Salimicrobium humidisoli]|uniref:Uncharacterized protein n=1 Tax=Salimicrobium humidisoli TaxID=2029857 RepID=A0ABX4HS93_9BACI|nr:hypothetical protein [Salimicrobium humidisoli]PBB05732.1 hypothetical protein CKW00_06955 [Salimicrobium humidisoli]